MRNTMPVRNIFVTAAAAAITVGGLAADAAAQVAVDNNAVQSGNWSDPATWDSGEPDNTPVGDLEADNAIINGGLTVTVDQAGENALRVDLGTGEAGNSGNLTMTGGDLTLGNPGNIGDALTTVRVGQAPGTSGTLTMSGGTMTIAGEVGSAFGLGELMIGDNGGGTLNMTGGTITAADEVFFGLQPTSTATATVSGGTVTAAGRNVLIGFDGDATVNISGTGEVRGADEVFMAFWPTSTSVANVSGGTLASGGRSIIVGRDGNATLNVSDAGTVRANWDVLVGLGDGSVGNINLTGGTIEAGFVFTNAFNNGAGSTVNVTQTGGTFNCRIAFVLGQGNGTTTMTHSGGVINALENNGDMVVGDGDFNTSTYNVSGAAAVNLLHNFIVGAFGGSNGIVNQTGGTITAGDNVFVGRDGAGAWTVSGGTFAAPNTIIANLDIASGTLNLNGGVVQTANLTGGAGASTLNLNGGTVRAAVDNPAWVGGGAGIDTIRVQAGGVTFDTNSFNTGVAAVLPHDPALATADGGVTKVGAGTLTLSAANTYNGGTRVNAGTLVAANANALGTGPLTVSNGATARAQLGLPQALDLPAPLGITAAGSTGGTFDLTDNAVVLRHASQSAALAGHTAVNNLVRNAFHDFAWDQPGVTSSKVAADIAAGIPSALGILLNNDGGGNALFYGNGADLPLYEGRTADANSVMVEQTLLGDGDLNGTVDSVDFALFQAGYTGAAPYVGWAFGDYDYNGVIDSVDFGLFQAGYQYSQANPTPEMVAFAELHRLSLVAAAVPEPATLGLLALAGGGGMLLRRRRAI